MDKNRALTSFISVARTGSFVRAASEEGVSTASLSRTIKQLEDEIGVRLFHRTTRKVSLTEEGLQLLELARPGLAILDEALESVQHAKQGMAGIIRISAPRSVGLK